MYAARTAAGRQRTHPEHQVQQPLPGQFMGQGADPAQKEKAVKSAAAQWHHLPLR